LAQYQGTPAHHGRSPFSARPTFTDSVSEFYVDRFRDLRHRSAGNTTPLSPRRVARLIGEALLDTTVLLLAAYLAGRENTRWVFLYSPCSDPRVPRSSIPLVHALHDRAKQFYEHYGFQESPQHPMTLMLRLNS
jgi:hypothetical protein